MLIVRVLAVTGLNSRYSYWLKIKYLYELCFRLPKGIVK